VKTRTIARCLLSIVATLLLCGCSQSANDSGGSVGTLNVRLTDAPLSLSNVDSVMVTLTGVVVYPRETVESLPMPTEPPPITLLHFPAVFDLLTLTGGTTTLLASGEVPVGDYSRIRLEISSAMLIYTDGTRADLKCEPNKVDVPIRFHVSAGTGNTLLLDFDAGASVKVNETGTGDLILRPVVTPVPVH
jgi:hypothetical protein